MSTDPAQQLTFKEQGKITVGTIHDANMFDAVSVTHFGNTVLEYIKDKPGLRLLLDFKKVDYLSSAALTELLRINEALRKSNGSVRLCSLTKDIRKVFEITNLEKLFVIHGDDDVQTALKRFERSLAVAADDSAWAAFDKGD